MKTFMHSNPILMSIRPTFFIWAIGLASQAGEPWTLERAEQLALTNSPDTHIAARRVAAADAMLRQANSAAWPKLQLQSAYTRTDNPMMVFGSILNQRAFGEPPIGPIDFNDVPDIDNLNLKGVVSMPIYAGGQIKNAREAARAFGQATREQAQAVRITLSFEVARAFFTIQKTRQFIQAAEAAVNSFQQNLEVAKRHFENGTRLRADVLDLEVRLAQAEEDLLRAKNAHALALKGLRTLMGIENQEIEVADQVPELRPPDKMDLSNRPELAAARAQIRAAEAEVRRAKGGYLPTVGVFASVDHDRGWRSEGDGTSYTAGMLMQWNVFDGQLTRGKVQEALANLETAQETERKLKLAFEFELQQAQLNLREAEERLRVTEKAVASATESATLTRARFEQGLALTTQLIDSETALTAARVRHAEAKADYQIAIAALRKAVGLPMLP